MIYCGGDVELKTDEDGFKYLEFKERQSKTRTGENVDDIRPVTPKMYATSCERDQVAAYEKYASKRPVSYCKPEDPFYIASRTIAHTPLKEADTWFTSQRVGQKKLSNLVKVMSQKAGFEKKLTNHSARKRLVQKLRDSGVEGHDIIQISGHRSVQSINNYSEISAKKHRQCSNILSSTEGSSSTEVSASERAPVTISNSSSALSASERAPVVIRNSSSAVSTSDRAPASASDRAPVVINNSPICPNSEGSPNNVLSNITTMTHSAQNNSLFYGATLNIQNFHLHINKE